MVSRQQVSMRLGPQALEWVDARAAEHGLTRTQVIRVLFSVALADESARRRVDERLRAIATGF